MDRQPRYQITTHVPLDIWEKALVVIRAGGQSQTAFVIAAIEAYTSLKGENLT